jgi:hypothetical protein
MFFFAPKILKIKHLFEIKQGKNISSEFLNQESDVSVLNHNSLNFDSKTIDINCLKPYHNFDIDNDIKFFLKNSDFLIQRTGGGFCKSFSMLDTNFEALNKKIIISHNFLFARPLPIFPKEYLAFYHFLLSIAIEKLYQHKMNIDKPSIKNIKYVTIREIEELELPINLEYAEYNEITLIEFNHFNSSYNTSLKNYNKALVKLNEIKSEFENFKNDYLVKNS